MVSCNASLAIPDTAHEYESSRVTPIRSNLGNLEGVNSSRYGVSLGWNALNLTKEGIAIGNGAIVGGGPSQKDFFNSIGNWMKDGETKMGLLNYNKLSINYNDKKPPSDDFSYSDTARGYGWYPLTNTTNDGLPTSSNLTPSLLMERSVLASNFSPLLDNSNNENPVAPPLMLIPTITSIHVLIGGIQQIINTIL